MNERSFISNGQDMGRKKDIKTSDTRAVIIQAAFKLFLANGFHGTSMRQIASKAGLTVAAAYNHFKNKEQLYTAVLKAHHPYIHVLPALAKAEGETIEEFLAGGARMMIAALDREPGFLKLMFIEIVEFNSRHIPGLFQEVVPQLMTFAQSISKRKGRLRPFPLPVLVRSFAGLFFSYYITELLIWKYLPPAMQTECLDDFIDIYLHGVIALSPAATE
jgi:AcrR family transcriptional regulator